MKTLYKIGMLAVAALAFAGCSKEVDNTADQKDGTHTLTFTVQKDIDTKTAVEEGDGVASYVWTEGDDEYFHIYENGKEATEIVMDLSEDKKIATFLATFANTNATEFTYTATYGSNLSNSGNPLIPSTQTPALNSFDPAADVLVSAEPITFEGSAKAAEDAEFQFKLKRVVSANKMTLKGLVAGEKVKTVKLTSTDGCFSQRYMIADGSYSNDKKELTFDFSENAAATVGLDGTFPVYFISAPVTDATFSVSLTTDQHVYSRDMTSKLTLATGTFRRFGINLEGYGEEIIEGTVYTLVTNNDDIYDGATYIIATSNEKADGTSSDASYALGLYTGGNNHVAVEVTKSSNTITIDNTIAVEPVIINSVTGGYSIVNAAAGNAYNGFYFQSASGNSNYLKEAEGAGDVWGISINNGVASIVANDRTRGYMYFNSSNSWFACYADKSSAQDKANYTLPALYVDLSTCVELEDPELSFEGEATINVNWADIAAFTAPTLNNPHNVTVTYSSSDTDVATVDSATGEIEFVGDGTTVITATSAKTAEYKSGTAQYTLVVTGAPVEYDFTTVAELNALAAENAGEVTGTLTNAVVSFVPGANDAIIKDASGSILYHKNGHGLKQGLTFSGETKVTVVLYYGVCEITEIDAVFTGVETVVAPETVAIADIANDYNTWQGAYVKVENLEVDSVSGKNVYVKNGNGTYLVYSNAGNATCVSGDIITVVGTVTKYSGNPQIKVWDTDGIIVTQEHQKAKHTITFAQPEEGGTFTVSANGAQISSGAELDEDTVVTIAAIAADGFTFGGWTVSGATVSGNTETATFTVGVSDVEIIANFISNSATVVEFVAGTDTGDTSVTKDGITVSMSTMSRTDNYRTYANTDMTVSAENGKTITKVEVTCTASGTGNYGPGKFSGEGYTYEGQVGTWTGSASTVTLSASSQVRMTSIKVTYQ